ncbi:MAG: hypothetical protein IT249_03960 [Chitinophagaceae bacterium]|nr:hypothetical protein [Chitinophagaceae bacterium]
MKRKKRWLVIIVAAIAVTVYFFLFFKTYSETGITSNADHIISLDVKRITNTVIWTYITTPSLWKVGKIFSSSGKVDWKDMVKIPDYIFIFHVKDQPLNAWYTVLEIKDEGDFNKGLALYGFSNIPGTQRYASKETGLECIRFRDKLLIGNLAVENKALIAETAAQLFVRENHIDKNRLRRITKAAEHLAWDFNGNELLKNINGGASFNNNSITARVNAFINTAIEPAPVKFNKPEGFLLSAGFVQPPGELYRLIGDSSKQKASRWLNFNIDSLFLPGNSHYQTGIKNFINKTDTAVTYAYDADFNQVENKVINKIWEPSFSFEAYGRDISGIYNYWNRNKNIEKTPEGDLFTAMPFVKSYCSTGGGSLLSIRSYNYSQPVTVTATDSCFLYASLDVLKIPDSLVKYLPDHIRPFLRKIASVFVIAKSVTRQRITVDASIDKRKGEEWFE